MYGITGYAILFSEPALPPLGIDPVFFSGKLVNKRFTPEITCLEPEQEALGVDIKGLSLPAPVNHIQPPPKAPEEKKLQPARMAHRVDTEDPLFAYWWMLHAGQGKSVEELYESYQQLSEKEKQQLYSSWSEHVSSFVEMLLYGPALPAKDESTEEYLQTNRIISYQALRKLAALRKEADFKEKVSELVEAWLKHATRGRGDGFEQEQVDSEGENGKKGEKIPPSGERKNGAPEKTAKSSQNESHSEGSSRVPPESKRCFKSTTDYFARFGLEPRIAASLFHAVSAQLPQFEYKVTGVTLREAVGEFLAEMESGNLSLNQLIPGIIDQTSEQMLFQPGDTASRPVEGLRHLKQQKLYQRLKIFFSQSSNASELSLYRFSSQAETPGETLPESLVIPASVFCFFGIVFTRSSTGMQVSVLLPGGITLPMVSSQPAPVRKLLQTINQDRRTTSLSQVQAWLDQERLFLREKIRHQKKDQGKSQSQNYRAQLAQYPEQLTASCPDDRPVVILLYDTDRPVPRWSRLQFTREQKGLAESYPDNCSEKSPLMLPARTLHSRLFSPEKKTLGSGPEDDKAVLTTVPEPVAEMLDKVSSKQELAQVSGVETGGKKVQGQNDKNNVPIKAPQKTSRKGQVNIHEITSDPAPDTVGINNGHSDSPSITGDDGATRKPLAGNGSTRAGKGKASRKKPGQRETGQPSGGESSDKSSASSVSSAETGLVSHASLKTDVDEVSEWLPHMDAALNGYMVPTVEDLEEILTHHPEAPDRLLAIMQKGLLKTAVILRKIDARIERDIISLDPARAEPVMAELSEVASQYHCPYAQLLYGALKIPGRQFDENSYADSLLPLLQASLAGVHQAVQIAGNMLLQHHPSGYPQVLLPRVLMTLANNRRHTLKLTFRFINTPERELLDNLLSDKRFSGLQLQLNDDVTSQSQPFLRLVHAFSTRSLTELVLVKGVPEAGSLALLKLLLHKKQEPVSDQVWSQYWQQALRLKGIAVTGGREKNRKKTTIASPRAFLRAVPVMASDLALYNWPASLQELEPGFHGTRNEADYFQQFSATITFLRALAGMDKPDAVFSISEKAAPLDRRLAQSIHSLDSRLASIIHNLETAEVKPSPEESAVSTATVPDDQLVQEENETEPEIELELETPMFPREWLSSLDQRLPRDLDLMDYQSALSRARAYERRYQQKELAGDQLLAGYYCFIAAIKLLGADYKEYKDKKLAIKVILLRALDSPLSTDSYKHINTLLKLAIKYGFPYAPLVQVINDTYGSARTRECLTDADKKLTFCQDASQRLFSSCWAGVEQAVTLIFSNNSYCSPVLERVGMLALLLKLLDSNERRYRIVFNISSSAIKNMPKVGLYPNGISLGLPHLYAGMRTQCLDDVLKEKESYIVDYIKGTKPVISQLWQNKEFELTEGDARNFNLLAARLSGKMTYLEKRDTFTFCELCNIPWMPVDESVKKKAGQWMEALVSHPDEDELSAVQTQYLTLLGCLCQDSAPASLMPVQDWLPPKCLDPVLLLSDPFTCNPELIPEVTRQVTKVKVSASWRARMLLLYARVAQSGLETVPLKTAVRALRLRDKVPREKFEKIEKELNLFSWQDARASEYDSLAAMDTPVLVPVPVPVPESSEVQPEVPAADTRPSPVDFIDIQQWRANPDQYFIEAFQQAREMGYTSLTELYDRVDFDKTPESHIKQGLYLTLLGLVLLRAKVDEGIFNIPKRSTDNAAMKHAGLHFYQAGGHGFPYGAYLHAMTTVLDDKEGYQTRPCANDITVPGVVSAIVKTKELPDSCHFDVQSFFSHVFAGFVTSSTLGVQEALLDLAMIFSHPEFHPTSLQHAGLMALLIQWQLASPYQHRLTFRFSSSAPCVSGFLETRQSSIRGILSELMSVCHSRDSNCFTQQLQKMISGHRWLTRQETIYLHMLTAILSDNPLGLMKYVFSDCIDKSCSQMPDDSPIILLDWLDSCHAEQANALLNPSVHDSLGKTVIKLMAISLHGDDQRVTQRLPEVHTMSQKLFRTTVLPALYATSDPFVTNKNLHKKLRAELGAKEPDMARWFARIHWVRYLLAVAREDSEQQLFNQENLKNLMQCSEVPLVIENLAILHEFYNGISLQTILSDTTQ